MLPGSRKRRNPIEHTQQAESSQAPKPVNVNDVNQHCEAAFLWPVALYLDVLSAACSCKSRSLFGSRHSRRHSTCDAVIMPLRRSQRIRPFVMAVVFLFHTELLSFCGMSNPRMSPADRRLKPALHIFGRKPEEPAEPEPSQDISTMDERAVSHWLRTLSMDQYISRFEEEGICGLLLANLTEQDLQDIGIDKGLHRKKILMYRDKLQVEGVKALSVRDQWHLNRKYSVARVNGLPDPGVQRFAPAVLDHLKNQEMDVRASEERFIKHVDDLDADLLEQSLYLETLEAINHVVCSQTAFVDQDGGCVREEIQSDSLQVVQGKNALRERIMATRANTEQLAIAVNRFSQANRNKMTDSERDIAKSHLNKSIEMWKEKMLEQAKKASFCNEGLLQRLSERLQSQLPGGFAVRANLQDFSKLTEDKEKAAEKCKRIYNLADRDVQLALEARSGGLKERIDDVPWLPWIPSFGEQQGYPSWKLPASLSKPTDPKFARIRK